MLVMTDQHRFDALSATGDWVSTPHLDRIAAEGTRFSHTYTNSPACIPARVTLATGRYPHHTGVWQNQNHTLDADAATWMRAVRDAGYATSVFGKTHLHPHTGDLRDREHLVHSYGLEHVNELPGPRALVNTRCHLTDLWEEAGVAEAYREDMSDRLKNKAWEVRPSPLPLELYPDVYTARMAREWLTAYDDDRPWMCWLSFGGPHEPWDAPEGYAGRFDPAAMPAPLVARDPDYPRPTGELDLRQRVRFEGGEVAHLRADYAGSLALIDEQVGEVFRVIEERGEMDSTVVVLVSDHGEMNGDFGLLYKQNFLDPATRIPFLLRVPGGPQGLVRDNPVELMDLGATLVEIAGGTPLPGSPARSVLPQLEDDPNPHRHVAISEYAGEILLINRNWKMGLNRRGETYLLFDLTEDPFETLNLAGRPEHEDEAQRLRNLLLKHLTKTVY